MMKRTISATKTAAARKNAKLGRPRKPESLMQRIAKLRARRLRMNADNRRALQKLTADGSLDGMSLRDIGKVLGCSGERIRQLRETRL
jgi:uncharacterized protein YjiS (DUF1127 family)